MAFIFAPFFVALALTTIIYVILNNFYLKRRKLPPGPTPLPFVGNLISIIREPPGEDCYIRWAKKYGSVYTYWMGEVPIVCVADYMKMVETFVKDGEAYAGRYFFKEMDHFTRGGSLGIANTNGELWREQRRFALHVLRDFGIGKNIMQEKILGELAARFAAINADIAAGVQEHDIVEVVEISISSIINSLLFGFRFDEDNESTFHRLKTRMHRAFVLFANPLYGIANWKPAIFTRLPYFKEVTHEVRDIFSEFFEFFDMQIQRHYAEYDLENYAEPSTDYVEAFLKEMIHRNAKGEHHYFSAEQLKHSCFDLWSAGQDTTSNTLLWGIAYLLHLPHVVEKMQRELDATIGDTDRMVQVTDKPRLPYMNAVVAETQRIANLAPQNLLHRTMRDVKIDGYSIPEGTCIVPQMSCLLYSDQIYNKPREFRPERFIDEKGEFVKSDPLIPFSIGKRQCPGESLARMELFLITSNLFNQYKIFAGKKLPSLKRMPGVTVANPRFTCYIEKRKVHTY